METVYTCNTCLNKDSKANACACCITDASRPNAIPSHWIPKMVPVEEDLVNHPSHYKTESGIETIDVIEAFTKGLEGIEATDTGNIIKYICRWKKKNGLQDLKKAQWYLNHLINKVEEKETKKNEN